MSVRRPRAAGTFYPADPDRLIKAIESSFEHRLGPGSVPRVASEERRIISVVSPHAGYMYSGPVAAHSYHSLAKEARPRSVVIVGPNHTGLGSAISIMSRGAWATPLGEVKIDQRLAEAIVNASDIIDVDESAHLMEHSIEVQLPFLQRIYGPEVSFVPICVQFQDLDSSMEVGRAIAEAAKQGDVVIIASTDLSHYEPQATAKRKDSTVIESIISLDEASLQQRVNTNRVSMCGYGPVSAAIHASKILGATKAELLAYHTSGDITGDYSAVVGYASAKITR